MILNTISKASKSDKENAQKPENISDTKELKLKLGEYSSQP